MADRRQRLIFLAIAAVIALAAVLYAVSRGGDDVATTATPDPTATPSATASPTATAGEEAPTETPTEEPTPRPTPQPPLLTGEQERRLTFKKGETVRFRVRSPVPEEVHVHAYDIREEVAANRTETISFKATIDGLIEVEFERSHKPIAQLRIEP